MEGFKCRKLNRSGGGIEIIFPIDFGIYLSVIPPPSVLIHNLLDFIPHRRIPNQMMDLYKLSLYLQR